MAVINNLYPPIVETYMPAFLIEDNSNNITNVNKTYYKISHAAKKAYDEAIDQYITGSTAIDGVDELWNEYEYYLTELENGTISITVPSSQYTTIVPVETITVGSALYPSLVEAERELKTVYDTILVSIISGKSNARITEVTFFSEEPNSSEGVPTIASVQTIQDPGTINNRFICRIYFSLSLYNTIDEIANAQISIRKQSNNANALNSTKYYSGVALKEVKTDSTRETNDKYYIEIYPEDMENCNFIVDEFYKVQIRFTGIDAEDISEDLHIDLTDRNAVQAIDEWLSNNLLYFSEWSTACLIRGISVPNLVIDGFSGGEPGGQPIEITDNIANSRLVGKLYFADENETETLRSYRIKGYSNPAEELLFDSGEIFVNEFSNANTFEYNIKYWFRENNGYQLKVTYTTQNLYEQEDTYVFYVNPSTVDKLNVIVEAKKDEENGRIGISVKRPSSMAPYTGQIIIKRSSNKSNYTIWEDMYITNYKEVRNINFTWYDYTIENGIWYLYAIQGVNKDGIRTPMQTFKEPVMLNFDSIFLTSKNKQLKIEYNPTISSFKHTLSEARIDTIGGKYPFIKRNGNIDYVQFPLGGMIFSTMDEDGTFTTKEEAYGRWIELYNQYNKDNNIPTWNDLLWEKNFRDKVIKFLYEDDVKLFRSPTEGNYLIRLMDVQFQPNQALGRQLWSFTSNAYEIDECSIENYNKYNIVDITDGNTSIGTDVNPDALKPVTRVIFIASEEQFPIEGKEDNLYIFNKQIYLWNQEDYRYNIISIPLWNTGDIDYGTINGVTKTIYTDGKNDVYQWDANIGEMEKISVSKFDADNFTPYVPFTININNATMAQPNGDPEVYEYVYFCWDHDYTDCNAINQLYEEIKNISDFSVAKKYYINFNNAEAYNSGTITFPESFIMYIDSVTTEGPNYDPSDPRYYLKSNQTVQDSNNNTYEVIVRMTIDDTDSGAIGIYFRPFYTLVEEG